MPQNGQQAQISVSNMAPTGPRVTCRAPPPSPRMEMRASATIALPTVFIGDTSRARTRPLMRSVRV